MTESEQQKSLPTDSSETENTAPRAKRGISLIGLLALLLALAALAGNGYLWWLNQQQSLQQQAEVQALQSALASKANRDSVQALQQVVPDLQQQILQQQRQQQQKAESLAQLSDSVDKLFSLYARDRDGWMLAEVEYLLRIAQHRLLIEADFDGAAAALHSADERLAAAADPGTLPIRVRISEEIGLLKGRSRPDLAGIHLSLNRLQGQSATLKPGFQQSSLDIRSHESADRPEGEATESEHDDDWQQQLQQWAMSLVQVRRDGEKNDSKTLDTPIYRAKDTLNQQLRLAQWALLDRDQYRFQTLIGAALLTLEQHYDAKKPEVELFIRELTTLKNAPLRAETPNIGQSLTLLRQLLATREQQRRAGLDAALARTQAATEPRSPSAAEPAQIEPQEPIKADTAIEPETANLVEPVVAEPKASASPASAEEASTAIEAEGDTNE